VGRLASDKKLPAPALLIVGRVASHEIQELTASFWDRSGKNLNPQYVPVI
jgi:hypothetical protein